MTHQPVMLEEALEHLAIRPDGIYLDATAGLGGHTGAIARQLGAGLVIANDRDPESLELARQNTADAGDRIRFHHGEFSTLHEALRENGIEVTALHSHMLTEEPRLFFMHFWANDDAGKLAKVLRAALDLTNSAKP